MEEQTPKAPVPAIEVRDLKKSFRIYNDKSSLLKDRLLFWKRNKYQTREVLRGLTFDVAPGEAVGLIGHNGCGKSTTLKMLTKIMYPNAGTIKMRGRVSALIELGAGFHPDMSGRENIYTNAAIFGLSRKEVNERMDTIIGFSELGEYIDNPVRTYSSGMYMRLAFSVAINVDADILLVDEILAVGDVVNARITAIDYDNKKVSLSIRSLLEEAANAADDEEYYDDEPADDEPADEE